MEAAEKLRESIDELRHELTFRNRTSPGPGGTSAGIGDLTVSRIGDKEWHDLGCGRVPPKLMQYMLARFDPPRSEIEEWKMILEYLLRRDDRTWVPDTTHCQNPRCKHGQAGQKGNSQKGYEFLTTPVPDTRAHHCRVCGECYCSSCAPTRPAVELPEFVKLMQPPPAESGTVTGAVSYAVGGLVGGLVGAVSIFVRLKPPFLFSRGPCPLSRPLPSVWPSVWPRRRLRWLARRRLPRHPTTWRTGAATTATDWSRCWKPR